MKKLVLLVLYTTTSISLFSQVITQRKGDFYIYWGWNWDAYSNSTIRFTGNDYDFKLKKVVAYDRQTPFDIKTYASTSSLSIPQYNYRIGYFINNHMNLSLGMDHMKYVVKGKQMARISGQINKTGSTYQGYYQDDLIELTQDFLTYEHTDGLNYLNFELRQEEVLYGVNNFQFAFIKGLGIGILIPKSNVKLLSMPRQDEFHIAGFGVDALLGLQARFFNHLFIQSEYKVGFIHLPDVRTTPYRSDKASQHFFFRQINVVFGGVIGLGRKT